MRKAIPSAALLLPLLFTACSRPIQQQAETQTVWTVSGATIADVHFFSPSIAGTMWYRIIVPPVEGDEPLPVLYLLHGANSGPVELMDRSDVVKLAMTKRLMVVMPDAGYSYYTNAKHKRNARWEDAITADLRRDLESRFPSTRGTQRAGIGGISMGGYGAIKLALKHPQLYAFAGAMSGALDITRRPATVGRWRQDWRIYTIFGFRGVTRRREDVFELLKKAPQTPIKNWFVSYGVGDPLAEVNKRFARGLREHALNVDTIETPGGHDWKSWNAAMPALFDVAAKSLLREQNLNRDLHSKEIKLR